MRRRFADRSVRLRVLARDEDIERSENDRYSYRIVMLPNGLEALLVHNPDQDSQGAACFNTGVGSYANDDDIPGIAHAVEHTILRGSTKYPGESEYFDHLSRHNGYSNAWTSLTDSAYYFSLADANNDTADGTHDTDDYESSPLYRQLDMLAAALTEPLFRTDVIKREMHAVDSEFRTVTQEDHWRRFKVADSHMNPHHPAYRFFPDGNYDTLYNIPTAKGIDLSHRFRQWTLANFSADRMKLTVLGHQGLDKLQKWVCDLFANIPTIDYDPVHFDTPILRPGKETGHIFYFQSIANSPLLRITFSIPDQIHNWDTMPLAYILKLIDDGDKGSLWLPLKARNWIESVVPFHNAIGGSDDCQPACIIDLHLTTLGFENYEAVATHCFAYLGMLASYKPSKRVWDEQQKLDQIALRFREQAFPMDQVVDYNAALTKDFDRRRLFLAWDIPQKFDPAAIEDLLARMTPQHAQIMISAQALPDVILDRTEPLSGAKYRYSRVPSALMDHFVDAYNMTLKGGARSLFHLPPRNPFIPDNLDLLDFHPQPARENQAKPLTPQLLRDDRPIRLWWKQDTVHLLPRAYYYIHVRSGVVDNSVWIDSIGDFWCRSLYSLLQMAIWPSVHADYNFEVHWFDGPTIMLSGYNDKIDLVLESILDVMTDPDTFANKQFFEGMKTTELREWSNNIFAAPFHQRGRWVRHVFLDGWPLPEQRMDVLDKMTIRDVKSIAELVFKHIHIEMLVYGNVSRRGATKVSNLVEKTLFRQALHLDSTQWQLPRQLDLTPGVEYIFETTCSNPEATMHCIYYALYTVHLSDLAGVARARLFGRIAGPQAWEQLRAQKQLAYSVLWETMDSSCKSVHAITVESNRSLDYVEQEIEKCLIGLGKFLSQLSDSDFQDYKSSHIAVLRRRPQTMENTMGFMQLRLNNARYNFESGDKEADEVASITKADLIKHYERYIDPFSKRMVKAVIRIVAPNAYDGGPAKIRPTKLPGRAVDRVELGDDPQELREFRNDMKMTRSDIVYDIADHLESRSKIRDRGHDGQNVAASSLDGGDRNRDRDRDLVRVDGQSTRSSSTSLSHHSDGSSAGTGRSSRTSASLTERSRAHKSISGRKAASIDSRNTQRNKLSGDAREGRNDRENGRRSATRNDLPVRSTYQPDW